MTPKYGGHNTVEYDVYFNDAIKNGLCWLPWIGKEYPRQTIKLLLVGESHYAGDRDMTKSQQLCEVDAVAEDYEFTRDVVYESRICRYWTTTTLDNINWAFVGKNNFDGALIWDKIAFYNFVQRPMKTVNERPTREDFAGGWRCFVDVVKIIKPTICIFIGNSAANYFDEAMAALNMQNIEVNYVKFINRAWAKYSELILEEQHLPIHSIRHTGRFFSWKVWHGYLSEKAPETMHFLEQQIADVAPTGEIPPSAQEQLTTLEHTKGLPTWLTHRPIIACNYRLINPDDYDDAKFISVGKAQYNCEEASVKIFRRSADRWSRQSEEVPIQRLGYMFEMLLAAILQCQNAEEEPFQTEMMEEIISPQDMDFLRDQIQAFRHPIFESLSRIRAMIDEIDPKKF